MGVLVVLISLAVVAGLTIGGYVFMPKGPDILVWRTCLVISSISCWLMWAITYIAQLNPLISPERSFGHMPAGSGGH
ncbi:hypothetical protein BASA50_005297 [Batrachochytrium salamandrivorans]|uniref:V-type proton ATPase subunit e n=1 Tax=Batrachochytrium salamandrivorans TaxID=1357716 RepID=A0ABQ8FD86_9FUNG|nr:hypothetical protein BASA62_010028 [Batrachochytrium salamandrivorans]KAH6565984.1 hypothetical protein BASA60_009633 [Batrachochytrium salamandrivorans]KAH6578221.1 hypothetical protein BASA62_000400 [Batrachochytrium salamandrivorans]KAH6591222.1 hypothetical protein BASA61_005017 [Batrachochytrium salamandrivorans]KAH6596254.1 hypothetical protein BASA50_005297 [Batrachochytrium salamandrivorans]